MTPGSRTHAVCWVLQNNLEMGRSFLQSPALLLPIFQADISAAQVSHWTCGDTHFLWVPHTVGGQLWPFLASGLCQSGPSLLTGFLCPSLSLFSSCMANSSDFLSPDFFPLITSFLSLSGPDTQGTTRFPELDFPLSLLSSGSQRMRKYWRRTSLGSWG